MKKLKSILYSTLAFFSLIGLISCSESSSSNSHNDSHIDSQINNNIHTYTIKNLEDFNYYFSFTAEQTFKSNYNYSTKKYETTSTSTISLSPALTKFVSYSGNVSFNAQLDKENEVIYSQDVLKNRNIDVDYWGYGKDVYTLKRYENEDESISFENVKFEVKSVNITITYYHEGVSGDKTLNYKSIEINSYNYSAYLNLYFQNKVQSRQTDRATYTNYYSYSINCSPTKLLYETVIYYEVNHVILRFENNLTLYLNAHGYCSYNSKEGVSEITYPALISVSGKLDIYPGPTVI